MPTRARPLFDVTSLLQMSLCPLCGTDDYCLLHTMYYLLLTIHYSRITARYLPLTSFCSLLTTYCDLLTANDCSPKLQIRKRSKR